MRSYSGYVFDLDGTIYLDNQLLPGAGQALAALRSGGGRLAFVSNNPTFTRAEIVAKLKRLGVPAGEHEVINSSHVMVQYLLREAPGAILYPVGEVSLRNELLEAGFQISEDPRRIDFVIASFDRTFAYRKLQIAFDAIRAGARFIATNADRYCPTLHGGEPDAAAVIAAIAACTGKDVELVVGKPSPLMARAALDALQTAPADTLLTGDRLETDILMGASAGMDTALALTGATRREQAAQASIRPTYIIESLAELIP